MQHVYLPASIKVLAGGLLDSPARASKPLMIEQIQDHSREWILLERQLSLRSSRPGQIPTTIQALQVLDSQPIPAGGQLLFSLPDSSAACSHHGLDDGDLVAFRRVQPLDHQQVRFADLEMAWRLNRQRLRLEPIDPSAISCVNPAEGLP